MADLTQLRAQIRRRAEYAVSNASPQLQQTLRSTSPRVTGLLQNQTSVTARGLTATAKAATPYASFVRSGTREYKIPRVKRSRKRGEKMLAFYWPKISKQMFLPQVTHPKTAGNSWWDNGLRDWPRLLEAALRRAPNG